MALKFRTDDVRLAFHNLDIQTQREWIELAGDFDLMDQNVTIMSIEHWGMGARELEVTVSINKKADISSV